MVWQSRDSTLDDVSVEIAGQALSKCVVVVVLLLNAGYWVLALLLVGVAARGWPSTGNGRTLPSWRQKEKHEHRRFFGSQICSGLGASRVPMERLPRRCAELVDFRVVVDSWASEPRSVLPAGLWHAADNL